MTDDVAPPEAAEAPKVTSGPTAAREITEDSAGAPEVKENSAEPHRDRRIWWTLVGVGVLILVGVVILGRPLVVRRLNAARSLDTAAQQVVVVSVTVNSVDTLVRAEVSSQTAAASREASPNIVKARKQLKEAVRLIDSGLSALNDDEQKRAALVRRTAVARIEMLDEAPVILGLGAEAAAVAPIVATAWAKTLVADALADQAIAQSNRQTKAGWVAAASLNTQAEQGFSASRDLFSESTTAFPEADLGRYVAYTELRLNQTRLSKQADAANLAGNIALANVLTASYNAADAQSTAAAAQLPTPPAKAIADGFRLSAESASVKYFEARKRAETADRELVDF